MAHPILVCMDFNVIPDILKGATPNDERPFTLLQMGELLSVSYQLAEHPILKFWMGESLDIFMRAMGNPEKYKQFNRTLVERTIWQSQHYGQQKLERGLLVMRSKSIEHAIKYVEWFQIEANRRNGRVRFSDEQIAEVNAFRTYGANRLEDSIKYFMTVCNDMITLIFRHTIADGLLKIDENDDEKKIKFLLRHKANLQQLQNQFIEKTYQDIMKTIDIELGYHKNVKEYLGLSSEVKAILDQFLAERNARVTSNKLQRNLLEDKLEEFCGNLKDLVLRVFS